MANRTPADPFEQSDGERLTVPAGTFSFDGTAARERTGATNARWMRGGAWNRFQSRSAQARGGLLAAIALVVLMALVIPLGIGVFAGMRRDFLASSTETTATPTLVVLSAEAQALQEQLDPIQAAYIMSGAIADPALKNEMGSRVDAVAADVIADDPQAGKSKLDDAVSYFVTTYSQSLPARADTILAEYPYSEWETDERIDELKAIIAANAQGQDLTALVSAVIELPQRIGDAMSEHLGNRVTYVPPKPTQSAAPTAPPATTATPAPTAPAPPGTVGPPGQTNNPGNPGNPGGPGNTGNPGNPDPTFTQGPGN